MLRGLGPIATSLALGLTALILTLTYLEAPDARSQVTAQAIPRAAATISQAPGQTKPRAAVTVATRIPSSTATPVPPNIWDNYVFPTAIPTPSPSVIHATVPYLFILSQYDWPLQGAIATMMCESQGQADAVSSTGAVGLFQIYPYATENFNPVINIANAYLKWLDGNRSFYKHWTRWGGCGAGW